MKKLLSTALISIILGGCGTTTNLGTMASDRKQFLLYPASDWLAQSAQSYTKIVGTAKDSKMVVNNAQVNRVTKRLIPLASVYRSDAAEWNWEVNTIKSNQVNAFVIAGGKIVVYTGIIEKLKLTDDELASIIGHEMAHALREHGRERASLSMITNLGLKYGGAAAGLSGTEQIIAQIATQYGWNLPNSRKHETEADLIGLELMARAGYNPNAAVSVWKKMAALQKSRSMEFMSTHPAPETRIQNLQDSIPKVMQYYEASQKK